MGEITKDKLDILRDADYIFRDEIAKAGLDRDINQYFAVLTSTRTVGVMGDFHYIRLHIGIAWRNNNRLHDC